MDLERPISSPAPGWSASQRAWWQTPEATLHQDRPSWHTARCSRSHSYAEGTDRRARTSRRWALHCEGEGRPGAAWKAEGLPGRGQCPSAAGPVPWGLRRAWASRPRDSPLAYPAGGRDHGAQA
eukprot:scaffold8448_cov239-Pinguiococcus_pyrenoidosus.AAC.2